MARVSKKEQIKFLKKWSAALRSGKYQQTNDMLARFDEDTGTGAYCCLGVATCVSGDRPVNKDDMDRAECGVSAHSFSELNNVPNRRFPNTRKFLRDNGEELLRQYFGTVRDVNFQVVTFIGMNDTLASTFDEIADIVDILVMEMQGAN